MSKPHTARDSVEKLPFLQILALVAASVAMLALSFHPAALWPLAWVALVPWLVALNHLRRWGAFLWSLAAGFGFFFFGVFWLAEVHWGAVVGAALVEGAVFAIFGALLIWLVRRLRLPLTLALPIMLVALEFARNFLFSGFPWLFLGHTQYSLLWVIQISDITGAYGVSFVVAAVNGLLADIILFKLKRSPAKFTLKRLGIATAVVVWLVTGVCVYGGMRLAAVRDEMREGPEVLVVQPNLEQAIKSDRSKKQTPFMDCIYLTQERIQQNRQTAHPQPDMIVWPETMLPSRWLADPADPSKGESFVEDDAGKPIILPDSRDPEKYKAYSRQELVEIITRGTGCPLFSGGVFVSHEPSTLAWWNPQEGYIDIELPYTEKRNSVYFVDADGRQTGRYDKVHLVPYGEYIALKDVFPFLTDVIHQCAGFVRELEPGDDDQQTIFEISKRDDPKKKYTFCSPICYEIVFGDQIAGLVGDSDGKRAQFIVNASNDGWFHESAELEQTTAIAAFRAVENRVGVVRATNTGISGFIKPDGSFSWGEDFLFDPETGENKSITGVIQKPVYVSNILTVYTRIGDVFAMIVSATAAVLLIVGTVADIVRKKKTAE